MTIVRRLPDSLPGKPRVPGAVEDADVGLPVRHADRSSEVASGAASLAPALADKTVAAEDGAALEHVAAQILRIESLATRNAADAVKRTLRAIRKSDGDGRLGKALWRSYRAAITARADDAWMPQSWNAAPIETRLAAIESVLQSANPVHLIHFKGEKGVVVDWVGEVSRYGLNVEAIHEIRATRTKKRSIHPHQVQILEQGRLTARSPIDGKICESSTSLLVYEATGEKIRPYILYYFSAEIPFITVEYPLLGDLLGIYIPTMDVYLALRKSNPSHILQPLGAFAIENAASLKRHLESTDDRQVGLLVSSIEHLGHSLLGDLEGGHQSGECGLLKGVDLVVRGAVSFFDHRTLFPELEHIPVAAIGYGNDAFKLVLDRRLLVVRPVSASLWLSRGLAKRLNHVAVQSRRQGHFDGRHIADAAARAPLVWFELRTNDRFWIAQAEGFAEIARALQREHPDLGIVLAGWSLPPEGSRSRLDEERIAADAALATDIMARAPETPMIDITGVSTVEKMAWSCAIDAHVSTYGSGLMLPSGVGMRPGVVLINDYFAKSTERNYIDGKNTSFMEACGPIRYVMVQTKITKDGKEYDSCFDVDWRKVHEHLKSVLAAATMTEERS